MKKIWEKARADIYYIESVDVIATSPLPGDDLDDTGDDKFQD